METDPVSSLFTDFWSWRLRESPEFASYCGEHRYDDQLDDVSLEGQARRLAAAKDFLKRCASLSKGDINAEQQVNVALLEADLESYIKGQEFHGYLFLVSFLEGIHVDFELFTSWMSFETVDDFIKYIGRLKVLPRRIEQVEQNLRRGVSLGITQHQQSMKGVKESFECFEKPAEETVLFQPFVSPPAHLDLDSQKTEALRCITEDIQPAFNKLNEYIQTEYMSHLRVSEGVSCLPNGRAFYEECLRWHLSLDLTPEEVHQKGLDEVSRIHTSMLKIIQQIGFDGSFKEFLSHLRTDDRFYFETKEDILNAFEDLCVNRIRPKLRQVFHDIPASKMIIESAPESRTNAPVAYYLAGTLDGSRPGKFYVNTNDIRRCAKYNMMTLGLHEGEPGHHFQGMYAIEMKGMPKFRQYIEDMNYFAAPSRFALYTAYLEGWGLYCEYLGKEMGLYDDPYDMFGHLSFEMHRACRLVIDTGIHAFGWTFERATEFLMENTALTKADVESEVRRYITWPGQACAYKIGQMKIMELRATASDQLGDKFDVRDFHDEALRVGITSLTGLENAIKAYVAKKKST